jgi:hypothetical protein
LDQAGLLKAINNALRKRHPLSIVRVGDGENIVMAQYTILPEAEFMLTSVGRRWPKHGSGVKLPDTKARYALVRALKQADIIGILPYGDIRIKAPEVYKRPLTHKVFETYGIYPKKTFDAYVTRLLFSKPEFWKALKNRSVILISKWAKRFARQARPFLDKYHIKVVKTIPIQNYYQYDQVLKRIEKYSFDVALIGAGAAALPLAVRIAKRKKAVAIDVGRAFRLVIRKKIALPGFPAVNGQPNASGSSV